MGPFNEANATIGRTWTLISKNLGNGGKPGINYMGTQGNNFNYNNVCFPENEEALPPGWNPLHVQKGFKRQESAVSVLAGTYLQQATAPEPPLKEQLFSSAEHMSAVIRQFGSVGPYFNLKAMIMVEPLLAQDLVKYHGFDTKEKLIKWLKENTSMTAWEYWRIYPSDLKKAKAGTEPYASWLKLPEGALVPVPRFSLPKQPEIPTTIQPDPITLVVVGGGTNPWYFAGDFYYLISSSIDKWR